MAARSLIKKEKVITLAEIFKMAFITKHTSAPSCNFCLTAALLLSLMMALQVSSAPHAGRSADIPSDPSAQEHIEQVLGGLEILIELGSHLNGTVLDIQDFQNVRITCLLVL